MEGPFFVLPSLRGSAVNLTKNQLNSILNEDERYISVSAFDASELIAPASLTGTPFLDFCGLHGFNTILTFRSCFQGLHSSAPSTDATFSADHDKGRIALNTKKWMDIVAVVKPAFAVCPSDSIPLSEPSEKKRKAVAIRNGKWEICAKEVPSVTHILYPDSFLDKESIFISTIPGNENLFEFASQLSQIQSKHPKGISMVSLASFPQFIAALSNSVTFIESPLPWNLSEKGIALVATLDENAACSRSSVLLDLNDHAFQRDIRPLQEGCQCYTCCRHTRAYIYHLLTVQEMNSGILLSIHNLFTVIQIVRTFRATPLKDRPHLINVLISQC